MGFDTDAAITATELLRFGHPWAALQPSTPPAPPPPTPPADTCSP
ncbi:hypothetical protein [Streptomyces sp. NPDC006309]